MEVMLVLVMAIFAPSPRHSYGKEWMIASTVCRVLGLQLKRNMIMKKRKVSERRDLRRTSP
jgi:hypothetical protein